MDLSSFMATRRLERNIEIILVEEQSLLLHDKGRL